MQHQLDTMVSTMTKGSSKPEATATAYQFSPQHTTALDGPQQPQQFQNRMNYDSQDAFQERMKNEMRRMQAGLDGGYENPFQ